MRVMLMIKGDPEPGAAPSEELLAAMGRYNDELKKGGVLLDLAGLHPSAGGRHGGVRAESSFSAMLSQDPCLGVWWISRRCARACACWGSNASYSDPRPWVLRLSITSTTFSAPG